MNMKSEYKPLLNLEMTTIKNEAKKSETKPQENVNKTDINAKLEELNDLYLTFRLQFEDYINTRNEYMFILAVRFTSLIKAFKAFLKENQEDDNYFNALCDNMDQLKKDVHFATSSTPYNCRR